MGRPLILHGADGLDLLSLAAVVASAAGAPLLDLTAESEPDLAKVLDDLGHASGVVVLHPDALLPRVRRLLAIERGVLVGMLPDSGASSTLTPTNAALQSLRLPALHEAHGIVGSNRDQSEAVLALLELWRRQPVAVAAAERSYCVDIGGGLIAQRLPSLVQSASAVLLVTDRNVEPLHAHLAQRALDAAGIRHETVVLPAGEEHKHLGTPQKIWERALSAGLDRRAMIVALGGGVVTDISGFAAASWMRGIRWVGLPTTLLAMVDASVGGKTGVDLGEAKNAVGAFWQPSGVLCDTEVLHTEPLRGYRSALAEVVKTGFLGDSDLLNMMQRNLDAIIARDPAIVAELVGRSVRVKARVVSLDEREGGLRATLNLGHTIGHALEADGKYVRWTHGEAVSLGLVAALRVGRLLGHTPERLVDRAVALLSAVGLPTALDPEALRRSVRLLAHDKKRDGARVKFVLCAQEGSAEVLPLPLDDLGRLIETLATESSGQSAPS
jgi:shikimate kinase/3-dehydroquinate synthase